jgi:Rrf2 family protein
VLTAIIKWKRGGLTKDYYALEFYHRNRHNRNYGQAAKRQMKLSTKARYGLRAMVDLALHYGKDPVLLKDIAKRQEVSMKYLDHIISTLKVSGLVQTARIRHGGYVLSRPPSEIKAYEVIRAYSFVLMNDDGSRGLNFSTVDGVQIPPLLWGVSVGLLVGGIVVLAVAILMIYLAVRRP